MLKLIFLLSDGEKRFIRLAAAAAVTAAAAASICTQTFPNFCRNKNRKVKNNKKVATTF
jgi:hypothetical protein